MFDNLAPGTLVGGTAALLPCSITLVTRITLRTTDCCLTQLLLSDQHGSMTTWQKPLVLGDMCVVVRAHVVHVQGGTYGGNAVACAAAVATIDILREEGVLDNVQQRGTQLMKGGVPCAACVCAPAHGPCAASQPVKSAQQRLHP